MNPQHVYPGAPRPPEEISVIRGQDRGSRWTLKRKTRHFIIAIDGERLGNLWSGPPREIYVLPGRYKLGSQMNADNFGYFFTFELETVAGHTYVIKDDHRGKLILTRKFWVEEWASSNVVAGPLYYVHGLFDGAFTTNIPPAFSEKGE